LGRTRASAASTVWSFQDRCAVVEDARADPIEEINASPLTRTVSRCARALLRSVSTASNGAARGVDTTIVRRSL
jgi:hypothetical protein